MNLNLTEAEVRVILGWYTSHKFEYREMDPHPAPECERLAADLRAHLVADRSWPSAQNVQPMPDPYKARPG